jgi:hypothetical protein
LGCSQLAGGSVSAVPAESFYAQEDADDDDSQRLSDVPAEEIEGDVAVELHTVDQIGVIPMEVRAVIEPVPSAATLRLRGPVHELDVLATEWQADASPRLELGRQDHTLGRQGSAGDSAQRDVGSLSIGYS